MPKRKKKPAADSESFPMIADAPMPKSSDSLSSLMIGGRSGITRLDEAVKAGTPAVAAHTVLLGFPEALDFAKLLRGIDEGLPYASYESLVSNLGVSPERGMEIVNIPRRTLLRRREEGRLSSEESERLVRASRVFAKALSLFEGDRAGAVAWLGERRSALGGEPPFALLRNDVGAREVEALIDRLEYGVFS